MYQTKSSLTNLHFPTILCQNGLSPPFCATRSQIDFTFSASFAKISVSIKIPFCDYFARTWRFRLVKQSYMWAGGWLGRAGGGALGADTSTWWALGSLASVAYEVKKLHLY
ncbi:hypothetical protein AVEN_189080-1 [Araneus ventricosus]|uniref:Uncharacterized protein n=1 Tax=Araneus ventricosus TaxID=182803 RepID=A0A4Y2MCU6_ARAVE|nr:hypothetical protein AVEN_189080-1 [Araneus ventricosus]